MRPFRSPITPDLILPTRRARTSVHASMLGFGLAGLLTLLSGCGSTDSAAAGTADGATAGGAAATGTAQAPVLAQPPLAVQAGTVPSSKRGVAYDFASTADLAAVAPAARWWYDYSPVPNSALPQDAAGQNNMEFVPMLWNASFDVATVERQLRVLKNIHYLLVLNEPNLTDQSNTTPQQAASLWPKFETVAHDLNLKVVGPAMTWGTMSGYQDPVAWLDAFYSVYRSANGHDPQIDYLAFHWYDYGLGDQLDRLKKYGKPLWVTEFANWHTGDGSAQIDTSAKQQAQMETMVKLLEGRSDVFRYAWFTGRWNNDVHYTSLLAGGSGQLTALGQDYLAQPGSASTPATSTCGTANVAQGRPATASSSENGGTPASAAFDGNTGTRWSSAFSDPQWVYVDLGSTQSLCGVSLQWEGAYGKAFQIQTSNDAQSWTSVYSTTTGTGGTQNLSVSGSGRYVRMYGTARGTGYGYSLYEMQVRQTP